MRLRLTIAILVLLGPSLGLAQNVAYRNVVLSSGGFPFPTIRVCTEPASGTPCTPLATNIYSDPAGTQPLTNPFTGDAAGNFTFYADPSLTYHVQVSGLGINTYDIANIILPGSGGGGGCSPCVISFNGRSNTVSPLSGDYAGVGIVQTVAATLPISIINTGNLQLGSSLNYLYLNSTSNPIGVQLQDGASDSLVGYQSGGSSPGWKLSVNSTVGTSPTQTWNATDIIMTADGSTTAFDLNSAGLTVAVPLNFTAGFQLNGSYGTSGYCPVSTGTGVRWATCGATGSVNSVVGTANQVASSGGANPVISLTSPLTFPGNLSATQASNGTNLFTMTRATNSSPSGYFLLFQDASSNPLGYVDVFGNISLNSFTATGSGAGLLNLGHGADNSGNCPGTAVCFEAPVSVTGYTVTLPGTGPTSTNGSVWSFSALAGTVTTVTSIPFSGSTVANVACGVSSLAGMSSGVIAVGDGSGCLKSSGVAASSITQNCNSTTITFVTVCGHVDSLSLVANLSSTNILTASAAQPGLYQLSVYMNGTANACSVVGSGQFVYKITYTDSNGAVTRTAGTLAFSTTLPDQQPAVISFWVQSAVTTMNVSGTYTACGTPAGSGAFTLDAHASLVRVE